MSVIQSDGSMTAMHTKVLSAKEISLKDGAGYCIARLLNGNATQCKHMQHMSIYHNVLPAGAAEVLVKVGEHIDGTEHMDPAAVAETTAHALTTLANNDNGSSLLRY